MAHGKWKLNNSDVLIITAAADIVIQFVLNGASQSPLWINLNHCKVSRILIWMSRQIYIHTYSISVKFKLLTLGHFWSFPWERGRASSTVQPSLCDTNTSAAQQDDDVNEQQADEDEGEVDEQLLQVPLGLRIHLDLRCSADGRLGHVLNALHEDSGLVRFWWTWLDEVTVQAGCRACLDWEDLRRWNLGIRLQLVVWRWAQVRGLRQPGPQWTGRLLFSTLLLSLLVAKEERKTWTVRTSLHCFAGLTSAVILWPSSITVHGVMIRERLRGASWGLMMCWARL